jgi:hypothetical protein
LLTHTIHKETPRSLSSWGIAGTINAAIACANDAALTSSIARADAFCCAVKVETYACRFQSTF